MKLIVSREALLKPLQAVSGVVERRQTLPVLANVLLSVSNKKLALTGTDLEVELIAHATLEKSTDTGAITVPARKFHDIVKALPDQSIIEINQENQRLKIKSGSSRFVLATLPAGEFPNIEETPDVLSLTLPKSQLQHLIECTSFAMALQDVRYYLNGMLFEVQGKQLRVVATDGHRLAMCTSELESDKENKSEIKQIILPRKGVLELARLISHSDSNEEDIQLKFSPNHIRAIADGENGFIFTSKLIDGKFPDYKRVLPKGGDKEVIADRQILRQALMRSAILSNEKFHGVRFLLSSGNLQIQTSNPEQEEAQEEIAVDYHGSELEIGFNINYVLDVLSTLNSDEIKMTLSDSNSSALVEANNTNDDSVYVVMPMRL